MDLDLLCKAWHFYSVLNVLLHDLWVRPSGHLCLFRRTIQQCHFLCGHTLRKTAETRCCLILASASEMDFIFHDGHLSAAGRFSPFFVMLLKAHTNKLQWSLTRKEFYKLKVHIYESFNIKSIPYSINKMPQVSPCWVRLDSRLLVDTMWGGMLSFSLS